MRASLGHAVKQWLFVCLCVFIPCSLAAQTQPAINRVMNGASFLPGPLAPGALASVQGSNLAGVTSVNSPPWPAGGKVQINGTGVPVSAQSPTQVNFQVPWELSGQTASLIVNTANGSSNTLSVSLARFSPGILTTVNGTIPIFPPAGGQGFILLAKNGKVAEPSNPAQAGDLLSIFCVGLGDVTNRPAAGAATPSFSPTLTTPTVTIGGVSAAVLSSGLAPGYVGYYRVDAQAPAGVTPGDAVPVVLSIGGVSSQTVTIAVRAYAGPLAVSPASLTFSGQRGGPNPSAQTLQVTSSDSSGVFWTATATTTSGGNWLSVSPASGTTPASISVSVVTAGLAVGSYSGQVSVSSGTLVVVSVALNISEPQPTIGLSAGSLQFTTAVGTNPPPQNVTVSNSGAGTLSWVGVVSYVSGSGWLSLAPPAGNAPTAVSVSVDAVTPALPAGTYRAQILIVALTGASNSPLALPVTLAVTAPAQLAVSPQFLNFQVTQGSGFANVQTVSITNAGSGTLNWKATATTSTGGNWLALLSTQGTAPATLTISVNPAGLAAGVYQGLVRITDVASNQSVDVAVALTVNPAAATILLSQSDVVFATAENNPTPLKQTLRVLNIGAGTLNWSLQTTIPSGGNWLTVDQGSGSSTGDPTTAAPAGVLVNPAGLPSGNHYGLVIASASGATNSPQLAAVHLRVVPPTSQPFASVLPSGFIFSAVEQGPSPPAQSFAVQNVGGGTLSFTVSVSTSDGVAWLAASPTQATAPAPVSVQVNSATLKAAVYRGKITLTFPGGATQDLSVLLVITPALTAASFSGRWGNAAAACSPTTLHAVSTVLPNNFLVLVGWPVPIAVRLVDNCDNSITGATVVASFLGTGDPSLVLRSLRDGLYTGTWVPLSSQGVRMSVKALNPPLQEATAELSGQVAPFSAGTPVIQPGGVVNGASFAPHAPVAPGSIVSLFGLNLAGRELQASAPLPRDLGGLSVKIGGTNAPLFYAGLGQVNAQVPFELSTSTAASVIVTVEGKVSPPEQLLISPVQPGIFTFQQGGVTRGAVLDAQFRAIDASNPAARGSVIQIFATGLGACDPPVKTGDPGPVPPAVVTTPVEVTIGGVPVRPQFAGLAPNFTGLYQVNVLVPSGLPAGDVPLVLTGNGISSNSVMLAVK